MIREEQDGYWIDLDETIAAHHDAVFTCLTTAGGLTRWLPVAAEVDLRQGGTIVLGWDEKMRGKTTVAILDYSPAGRITWDWLVSRLDQHAPVYWELEPSREQGVHVRLRQGPFRSDTDSLIAMAEEHALWRWHLCNLRATLEMNYDMRRHRPL